MKTTLKEFLTNGQLGEITLKTTPHQVRQLLGEPPDWGFSKFKNKAALWKYGTLQLGFANDQVTFLALYYHDHSCLPLELNVVGYFPTKQTACQEFRKYLWCEQLDYQVDRDLRTHNYVWLWEQLV